MSDFLPQVTIYTDGGCQPNPGNGGWAALLMYREHIRELSGSASDVTNNQMELTAAISALEALKVRCEVTLYTDSQYLKKGITEWLDGWKRKGWKTSNREPVKNRDLWERLDGLIQCHSVTWKWVKGHAGDEHNERVDELATKARLDIQAGGLTK